MKIYLLIIGVFSLSVVLISCGCGSSPDEYHNILYTGVKVALFNNEGGYDFLNETGNEVTCPANSLGIYVSLQDSVVSIEEGSRGLCFDKVLRIKNNYLNPIQALFISSAYPFKDKQPGEVLNEYFLISSGRDRFPVSINEYNLNGGFILLLKPYPELEPNSTQRFVIELHTDKEILQDTTLTVILQ